MAQSADDFKQIGQKLADATGAPAIGRGMAKIGETVSGAGKAASAALDSGVDYVKKKFAGEPAPAKRTTDIDLPRDQKRKTSGRSLSKR